MASSLSDDGIQRVSLSPTDSGLDPDDMEPCADSLPMEIDERPCGTWIVCFFLLHSRTSGQALSVIEV